MRILIFTLAIYFAVLSNIATALDQDFKKCLLALNHIESYIKKKTPKLSAKLARGLSGSLMMEANETYRKEELETQAGKIWKEDELNLCLNYGANKIQIHLLNRVMKNTIPLNPSPYLENCYGSLLIVAGRHESQFGSKAGFQKGKELGKLMGGAVTSVRYLYKQYDEIGAGSLLRKTQKIALKIYNAYARMPIKGRLKYFKSIEAYCTIFGIDVAENNFQLK